MKRLIPLPEPFLPRATLAPLVRGRGDPTMKLLDRSCIRATRTPEGSATIRMLFEPGRAACEAWGPGAGWAIEHLPQLLGAEDRPELFVPKEQPLRDLERRSRGLRFGASLTMTEVMIPTIIEQKVTGRQARDSYRRLVMEHSEPAPGPFELMLPPDPEKLGAMSYFDYHPLGIEKKRADVVRGVANEQARIDSYSGDHPTRAMEKLRLIPGVGPWTAAETVRLALGYPDAISLGDFHLPNLVAWALAGEPRADDQRMLELLSPYVGQRARVARLIELSGLKPPAFSHRRPIQAIHKI